MNELKVSTRIETLRSRRNELSREIVEIDQELNSLLSASNKLQQPTNPKLSKKEASVVDRAVERVKKVEPAVTDHAVLRYLECTQGFNTDLIRKNILKQTRPAILTGARSLKRMDLEFIFRGNQVITVCGGDRK